MKVVVTGGAGFIGANLCQELCARREVAEVVVVDNLSTGSVANLDGLGVTLIKESVLNRSALDAACAGADSIVHLAAIPSVPRSVEDPLASHAANATGTLEVLEAARRHAVGHIVVASSSSVYGANLVLPKHEGLCAEPMSPYAVSKLATEAYALAYRECFGLSVLALRFFNVFGPLQPAGTRIRSGGSGLHRRRVVRSPNPCERRWHSKPGLHFHRQCDERDYRRRSAPGMCLWSGEPGFRYPHHGARADRRARKDHRAPAVARASAATRG